jgi:hypothetical protein
VAAPGCQTHPQRAAAQTLRSRRDSFASPGLLWQRRNSVPTARRCRGPKRSVGPENRASVGVLKSEPTGGRTEQASNTARGTSERRRTCGLAIGRRPGQARRPASQRRRFEARGSVGPPAFRAPLGLFEGASAQGLGRKPRRENGGPYAGHCRTQARRANPGIQRPTQSRHLDFGSPLRAVRNGEVRGMLEAGGRTRASRNFGSAGTFPDFGHPLP